MEIIEFEKEFNRPITLCLGQFDSFHKGHRELVEKAKKIAKETESELAVFTFSNDLYGVLNSSNGLVYTFNERLKLFENFGVNTVIFANADTKFLSDTADGFINKLKKYDLRCIVVGEDYTFGKGRQGTAEYVRKTFDGSQTEVEISSFIEYGNKKISTTRIKERLSKGDIIVANEMLGGRYFVYGKVIHGREVGRTLGFPTVNVAICEDKFQIKHGVYKTRTKIDGKEYLSVTNYGNAESFGESTVLTETHLIDYDGDLYDKEVTVYFLEFLRDIRKFDDIEDLKKQLKVDTEKCK